MKTFQNCQNRFQTCFFRFGGRIQIFMWNLKFQINNIHNTHSRSTSTLLSPHQHSQPSLKINIRNTLSASTSTTLIPDQHPQHSFQINIHNTHSRSIPVSTSLIPDQHPHTYSSSTYTTLTPDYHPQHSASTFTALSPDQHPQHSLQINIQNTYLAHPKQKPYGTCVTAGGFVHLGAGMEHSLSHVWPDCPYRVCLPFHKILKSLKQ